jgi:hypothetical protein
LRPCGNHPNALVVKLHNLLLIKDVQHLFYHVDDETLENPEISSLFSIFVQIKQIKHDVKLFF